MNLLLFEDERQLSTLPKQLLEDERYAVDIASDGERAQELAETARYDAIILDLMIPKKDGMEVCRWLRQNRIQTPVIMLTARSQIHDRIAGLDSGCDDYLPKPFAFEELLARLRALLRRGGASRLPRLEYAGLIVDPASRTASRDGKSIELTNKEFALLELLMRRPGQVLTRTALLENVWGYDFDSTSNVLEVYMNFLRKKVDHGFPRKLLHTVRGVGYVLRDEED